MRQAFSFEALASTANDIDEYAKSQTKWADSDRLGPDGTARARRRSDHASRAANAIREFLVASGLDAASGREIPCDITQKTGTEST